MGWSQEMSKTNHNLPTVMDGEVDIEKISDIFANKYDTLYNSVGFSQNDHGH